MQLPFKSKKDLTIAEMTKQGGTATYKKYGKAHFQDMQKKSHQARLKKYGNDFYKELSRKGIEARKRNKAKREAEKNSPLHQFGALLRGE